MHQKTYDLTKLRFESVLGGLSAPVLTRAFSYGPPRPLGSPIDRASREASVARSVREVARSFGLEVIEPDASAPAGRLWTAPVQGPNLVELLNAGEDPHGLPEALHRVGRLHAYLAERWHSLGDVSWANLIASRDEHELRLTLCDFEHALWPQHAPFEDEASRVPPPVEPRAHWAPDDLYEGLVTTACKLVPRVDLRELSRAYAAGLAAESRVVAYAVARLFALRRSASWLRVGTTRWLDAHGATYMAQLASNYDALATGVADAVALPDVLRTVSSRPRAWARRTMGWLARNEYGWDATAYHDYARTFEDRDGVAARALLAIPELRDPRIVDVLDVGAGTGLIGGTAALCQPGWQVTLLDLSPEQVRYAERCYGARVRCVCAPVEALPLPSHAFDLILMASVLRYSADPARAVSEMQRVLRPGGRIVVLPTDFSSANDVLYAKLGLRSAESIEAFFCERGWRSVGPHWSLHVRRGFAARPLVFSWP